MSRTLTLLLLFAFTASAQELSLVAAGERIIDRDPSTASTNCLGWSFGPSPMVDARTGRVTSMYVASDVLANRCKAGVDPSEKFGDRIRYHVRNESWSSGVDVIDRSNFRWMQDQEFMAAHPETFVGHLASPSVIRADGRYYMAFVGSVDDRNLCAGEHFSANICGSCFDPWSYFVVMWAVSDDGIEWRVRERGPGNAMLIGRAPDASDKIGSSIYKGLTRVALVADGDYFYFGTQYWTRTGIWMVMFRIARDASEFGIKGEPQVWNANRQAWITCPAGRIPDGSEYSMTGMNDALSSIVRRGDEWMAFTTYQPHYNRVAYYTSKNLLQWTGPFLISSMVRFVGDGAGYDVSMIDPVAVNEGPDQMRLFFSSADGDERNGVTRDGNHDCQLDPAAGPTAPYMGTGIYEAILEFTERLAPSRVPDVR